MAYNNLTIPAVVKFKNDINDDIDRCIEIMTHNLINHNDDLTSVEIDSGSNKNDNVKVISHLISYYNRMLELYKSDNKKSNMDSDEEVDSDIFDSDSSDTTSLFHNRVYHQDYQANITKQLMGLDVDALDTFDAFDNFDNSDNFDNFDNLADSSVDSSIYYDHYSYYSRSNSYSKEQTNASIQTPDMIAIPDKNMFKLCELNSEIKFTTEDEINYDDPTI